MGELRIYPWKQQIAARMNLVLRYCSKKKTEQFQQVQCFLCLQEMEHEAPKSETHQVIEEMVRKWCTFENLFQVLTFFFFLPNSAVNGQIRWPRTSSPTSPIPLHKSQQQVCEGWCFQAFANESLWTGDVTPLDSLEAGPFSRTTAELGESKGS